MFAMLELGPVKCHNQQTFIEKLKDFKTWKQKQLLIQSLIDEKIHPFMV